MIDSRPVTIKEVARLAGVSTATVSHVINRTRVVSDGTRERVIEVMRGLKFEPNVLARNFRRQRTDTIGLVISNVANPFFPTLVRGVEEVAASHGHTVVLCNTDDDPKREERYLRILHARRVDGYIVVPTGSTDNLSWLVHQQRPVVLIDRILPVKADVVLADNKHGAFLAADHLIDHGYNEVAIITGPLNLTTGRERLDGYLSALRARGIPVRESWICEGDFRIESGHQHAKTMLGISPRPRALFVANNLMTLGVLQAAAELGLRVPEDLALVGFDEMPWARFVDPPLTVVDQPAYEMGKVSADLLFRRQKNQNGRRRVVRLPVHLIVRASCGLTCKDRAHEVPPHGGPALSHLAPVPPDPRGVQFRKGVHT